MEEKKSCGAWEVFVKGEDATQETDEANRLKLSSTMKTAQHEKQKISTKEKEE